MVLPPDAKPGVIESLQRGLRTLTGDPEGKAALHALLACDELRAVPARPTSPALQTLLRHLGEQR